MKTISKMFEDELKMMKEKGWDYIYVFIDVHQTILKPTFDRNKKCTEFLPHAKEALQLLTKNPNIKLVLWTCSYPEDITEHLDLFRKNEIHFNYVNKNPEVGKDFLGDFSVKPYFNILLDDKAGFDANKDWKELYDYLRKL